MGFSQRATTGGPAVWYPVADDSVPAPSPMSKVCPWPKTPTKTFMSPAVSKTGTSDGQAGSCAMAGECASRAVPTGDRSADASQHGFRSE